MSARKLRVQPFLHCCCLFVCTPVSLTQNGMACSLHQPPPWRNSIDMSPSFGRSAVFHGYVHAVMPGLVLIGGSWVVGCVCTCGEMLHPKTKNKKGLGHVENYDQSKTTQQRRSVHGLRTQRRLALSTSRSVRHPTYKENREQRKRRERESTRD